MRYSLQRHYGARRWIVEVTWDETEEILGRKHAGTRDDEEAIVTWLLKNGGPSWVNDAEGFHDETYWGLIGPVMTEE